LAGKVQEVQKVEGIVFTSCPFENEGQPWLCDGELRKAKGKYAERISLAAKKHVNTICKGYRFRSTFVLKTKYYSCCIKL